MSPIIRVGEEVFGKAAASGVAAELRLSANRFPGSQAVFAMTTRRIELQPLSLINRNLR
jgi:hypothetical protein